MDLLSNLKKAKALLLQTHCLDAMVEEHNIPCLTNMEETLSILKEEELVRVDPSLGLVFKGTRPTKQEMLYPN